jgi:hypothetical protein
MEEIDDKNDPEKLNLQIGADTCTEVLEFNLQDDKIPVPEDIINESETKDIMAKRMEAMIKEITELGNEEE